MKEMFAVLICKMEDFDLVVPIYSSFKRFNVESLVDLALIVLATSSQKLFDANIVSNASIFTVTKLI